MAGYKAPIDNLQCLSHIALKDRALLESNLSVRVMPRQKAPAGVSLPGLFLFWLISDKLNSDNAAVGGIRVYHCGIRSANLIANWFIAFFQFLIGIVHFREMFAKAK